MRASSDARVVRNCESIVGTSESKRNAPIVTGPIGRGPFLRLETPALA